MRALLVLSALCFVSLTDAAAYSWRLSQKEAVAIAERAFTAEHFKLSDYPERTLTRRADKHKWYVSFSPPHAPNEIVLDQDVLVVIDDKTGEAKVYYGV